jgi:hypothetical protein
VSLGDQDHNHSDVYFVQGYKRIEVEYVSRQKLETEKINRRSIARKKTRKQKADCETVKSSTRTTTRNLKTRNAELGCAWSLSERLDCWATACCIHTQPSSSIAQQLALCTFPSPLTVTRQSEMFKPSHMYTHTTKYLLGSRDARSQRSPVCSRLSCLSRACGESLHVWGEEL